MGRRGYNPHDALPPNRTERAKPGPIPTLGQLRKGTCGFGPIAIAAGAEPRRRSRLTSSVGARTRRAT